MLDVSAVRGKGSSPSVLLEAGVRSADILVAVTSSDETNIVACLIAEAVAPTATRVARLHDPAYLGASGIIDQSSLSIDLVISPEEEVAKAVAILAGVPGASDALEFAGGRVMAVGVEIDDDCPLVGRPVTDLRRHDRRASCWSPACTAGSSCSAPSADIRLTPGDTVFLVGGRDAMRRAMTRLGKRWVRTRNAVIAGGGWEGVAIARRLSAAGIHTKIIERDPAVCDAIVHELDDTLVLLGDAHDQSLLVDEGVQRADLFVSALGSEADNIVVALLAKRLGCRRVVSLVDTPGPRGLRLLRRRRQRRQPGARRPQPDRPALAAGAGRHRAHAAREPRRGHRVRRRRGLRDRRPAARAAPHAARLPGRRHRPRRTR